MNKKLFKSKLLVFISFAILSSCSTNKIISEKAQKYHDNKEFIVDIPDSWGEIFHHGRLSYSPFIGKTNILLNTVSIMRHKNKEHKTFKDYSLGHIKAKMTYLDIKSQSITKEITNLGETYVHVFESNFLERTYSYFDIYFQNEKKYYHFEYRSTKEYYDKYLNDVNSILKSLRFKNNP